MNKETRKALCPKCLKTIRKIEARYLKSYRIKVRQKSAQENGKVKIKKEEFFKCEECGAVGNWGNGVLCNSCIERS